MGVTAENDGEMWSFKDLRPWMVVVEYMVLGMANHW